MDGLTKWKDAGDKLQIITSYIAKIEKDGSVFGPVYL